MRTPKAQLVGVLLVLVATTAPGASEGAGHAWLTVAVAAGTAGVADVVFTLARGRSPKVPDGAVGTGVLLGMILDPTVPLPTIAAVAGGGVVIKQLVRTRRGHVFNPAAAALVAAGIAGVSAQSWWGVSAAPSYVTLPLVAISGLFLADRVNRSHLRHRSPGRPGVLPAAGIAGRQHLGGDQASPVQGVSSS